MNQNINRFFAIAMAGTIIFTGSNLTGLTAQAKENHKVQTVAGAGALFTEAIKDKPAEQKEEASVSENDVEVTKEAPATIYGYTNLGIANVEETLNVRETPSADSSMVGKMPKNAAGEILETLDGWYKIKSGTVTGYIAADPELIATGQEAKDLAMQNATQMAIITTDVLNVRVEPNTDSKIWTQIVKDERYPVVDQQDGWVQIDLGSVDTEDGSQDGDEKAYISTRDNNVEVRYALNEAIKFTPAKDSSSGASSDGSGSSTKQSRRSQLVNYALQFVGNRYVWGGTSLTNGVDCSGFTMRVMEKFGVSLPHYSGSQAQMGKKVTSATMKPGDLIFYAGSNGKVNHVAIYIGNGRIVHAASRRSGIKTSTWNYRTPVAIRSMLD